MSIEDRCRREIARLHACFEEWFNGEVEQTEENFEEIESSFADGFVLVGPDGVPTERSDLVEHLWGHWYHPADEGERIEIGTDEVRHLRTEGDTHVAIYVERQRVNGSTNERRSTAIFRDASDAPHGLEWLHVHETLVAA